MQNLTPVTRIEHYLAIINGQDGEVLENVTRIEHYLAKLAGQDVEVPEPFSRIEKFLYALINETSSGLTPVTRQEAFIAQNEGIDCDLEPITREEIYWSDIYEGGGIKYEETVTGKIVSFLTQRIAPLKIEANFTPVQNLNGFEAPWPPGGGKNKCPVASDSRNPFMIWGAGQDDIKAAINALPAGTYTITIKYKIVTLPENNSVSYGMYATKSGGTLIGYSITTDNSATLGKVYTVSKTFTLSAEDVGNCTNFYLYCDNSSTHSGSTGRGTYDAYDFQIENGNQPTAYTPYSNICPISGHTGCDIFDKAEYDPQATPTVSISFGQTVYGGQLTVNEDGTGSVKARPYYASYNGETLVGPWVSSMDAYAPGATPTTGAQVVDMGGTETTIPLTPGQVNALQGNNTVWVDDSGEIKVTFRTDTNGTAILPYTGQGKVGYMTI